MTKSGRYSKRSRNSKTDDLFTRAGEQADKGNLPCPLLRGRRFQKQQSCGGKSLEPSRTRQRLHCPEKWTRGNLRVLRIRSSARPNAVQYVRKVKMETGQNIHGNDTRSTQNEALAFGAPLCLPMFLKLAPSTSPRGEEHRRRREELCVRKLGRHMEPIEPALSFPATVERQEILVVEMHLDFIKV
jgi:hypothetical protein